MCVSVSLRLSLFPFLSVPPFSVYLHIICCLQLCFSLSLPSFSLSFYVYFISFILLTRSPSRIPSIYLSNAHFLLLIPLLYPLSSPVFFFITNILPLLFPISLFFSFSFSHLLSLLHPLLSTRFPSPSPSPHLFLLLLPLSPSPSPSFSSTFASSLFFLPRPFHTRPPSFTPSTLHHQSPLLPPPP